MTDEAPALSASTADLLLNYSPRYAYTFHRLLGGRTRPVTDAQEKGRLIHALLLEEGKGVEVIDAADFRTKAAKEARDAAREAGKIPVVTHKYEEAQSVAGRIGASIIEAGYSLEGGSTEVPLEWHEPTMEDGDVLCHGRLDWVSNDWTHIIDIKTTDGSACPEACVKSLMNHGGAIQHAAYISAVQRLRPELTGRVRMTFLFCELKEPFAVTPLITAGSMDQYGHSQWLRAVELWNQCLKDDHWPSYTQPGQPYRAEVPPWAMAREMEEEAA